MRRLEDIMNSLTDKDWGWWPFLFLRPRKEADIDNVLLLKMACCFGPLVTAFVLFVRFTLREPITTASAGVCVVGCSIAFFIGYKLTFAIFWNRRARRLRLSEAPSDAET